MVYLFIAFGPQQSIIMRILHTCDNYFIIQLFIVVLLSIKETSAWWLLAMPSAYQMALRLRPEDYKTHCHRLQYLVPKQQELCSLSNNMLAVVSQGAQMGLKECQVQFSGRHWNCSIVSDEMSLPMYPVVPASSGKSKKPVRKPKPAKKAVDMMQSDAPESHDLTDIFGGILHINSREKAYVHAVSAAGVAYRITRACSLGELPSCGCDATVHLKPRPKGEAGTWEWGGCSDDTKYGDWLSKNFVDSNDLQRKTLHAAHRLMNLHNNAAGRKAVRSNTALSCKCHGVSGSCTTKICWRRMDDFSKVGNKLYRKFDGAVRVKYDQDKDTIIPAIAGQRHQRKRDLVYLEESPDYCKQNTQLGILGTSGRRCRKDSNGVDSCLVLCCGRGYWSKVEVETYDCNCKFQWCCEVRCSKCTRKIEQFVCR